MALSARGGYDVVRCSGKGGEQRSRAVVVREAGTKDGKECCARGRAGEQELQQQQQQRAQLHFIHLLHALVMDEPAPPSAHLARADTLHPRFRFPLVPQTN